MLIPQLFIATRSAGKLAWTLTLRVRLYVMQKLQGSRPKEEAEEEEEEEEVSCFLYKL